MSETQISSPQELPDDFVQAEVIRATQPLDAALERGGMGAKGRQILGE